MYAFDFLRKFKRLFLNKIVMLFFHYYLREPKTCQNEIDYNLLKFNIYIC